MAFPRQVLGTIGKCIYCGTAQAPLSTEHLVPYGLDGPWELLQASCAECSVITGKFEQEILRNALLPARARLGLRTRRRKERPEKFPLLVVAGGKETSVDVPLADHLTLIALPIFKLPASLESRPYVKGIELVGVRVIQARPNSISQTADKYGAQDVGVQVAYQPVAFARLVAKIAYGFAVAAYGVEKLHEAYVLPTILGRADDTGRWVGCDGQTMCENSGLHAVKLTLVNGRLVGRVRLFAQFEAPEYVVVIAGPREGV